MAKLGNDLEQRMPYYKSEIVRFIHQKIGCEINERNAQMILKRINLNIITINITSIYPIVDCKYILLFYISCLYFNTTCIL